MPLHFTSTLSSSSPPSSSKPVTHRRLQTPLNIMRSLSLCRKSRPTCTLSLAHVSACKLKPAEDAKQQVDTLQLDLSTIHFVAVPIPHVPTSPNKRRTKANAAKITTTKPHDINVIPFPTSTQTAASTITTSPASPTPISHTPNSFKRQQLQKKEDLDHPSPPLSSSLSPPRKRARKGTVPTATATTPPSSSRGTPSPRARALAQRVPPARPSTPTPDSQDDDMDVGDKSPVQPSSTDLVQDAPANHQPTSQGGEPTKRDLEKHGHTELPPYSLDPPPYSPPVVVAPIPISSPTPIPLHAPVPALLSNPSPPTSSSTTAHPPTSPPRSPPPAPPPSPSSSPPPPRRPRISPSELRFFIFLYRTLISGLETRQRGRSNTQVRRSRDGSRREQHLDGVLVEMDDDDDDDIDVDVDVDMKVDNAKDSDSLNEDLEVQDALLALRLRGFLKWNGVDEWMLKIDSPPPSPTSTTTSTGVNPFLEDGTTTQMDVDVHHPPPMLSSRHLITVLRMRGTCGPRQGGPIGLGMKNKRESSKLRMCLFKDDEGQDV